MSRMVSNSQLARALAQRRNAGGSPGTGRTGLANNVQQVFDAICYGKKVPSKTNLLDVTVRRWSIWHRQTCHTTTTSATSLTYFNSAATRYRTNMWQQSQLPNDHAFALERIGVCLVPGITLAGAVDTDGHCFTTSDIAVTAVTGAGVVAEDLRHILQSGHLKLTVGDKVIADAYDLTRFPCGHGPYVQGASSCITDGTTGIVTMQVNNGAPGSIAGWNFRPAYPITPGKQINCEINWEAAWTVLDAGYVMMVELDGQLVTPSNI